MMRRLIETLAEAMPDSTVHAFPEAGHNVHLTHPEEFASTITGFAMTS